MRAAFFTVSKISTMLSPMGRTKQAESWPRGRPAFIRVGELGRKRRLVISSKNSSDRPRMLACWLYFPSAAATASATRRNICSTVSTGLPFSSFAR